MLPQAAASFQQVILGTARDMYSDAVGRVPYLIAGLVVFLIFFAAGRLIRRFVHAAGARANKRANFIYAIGRLASAGVGILGFLTAAVIVFPTFTFANVITGMGLTSVAIGFAFKDVLQNFFAGILILWREPFRVGDEIEASGFAGVVEEVNTRSTRVRTYDGERAVIPNGEIYTQSILVKTAYDKRRVRFVVGVGYGDGLSEARQVMLEALTGTEGVLQDPGPWVYLTDLAPSSVNFTVFFWTKSPQRNVLQVIDAAIQNIKETLDRHSIDIPYPHTVVHMPDSQAQDEKREPGGSQLLS
jgi:small-conductance mechanosensitive channel